MGEPEDKEEKETKEEKEETNKEDKKPGFLDNLKSIGSHVQLPSFLSKKESKVKDVEAGEDKEEESKELLEKKERKNHPKKKRLVRPPTKLPKSKRPKVLQRPQ